MSKRAIVLFSLVCILVISTAGYLGFSTTKTPEPTPTPETLAVTTCDVEQTVTEDRKRGFGMKDKIAVAVVTLLGSGAVSWIIDAIRN